MALMVAPIWPQETAEKEPQSEQVFISFSFLPNIGAGGFLSSNQINTISINLLAGKAAGLNGVEFGGLANMETGNVRGAQFAGIANLVGGSVEGAQFGGIINRTDAVKGVQFAGISNVVPGDVEGIQVAGIVNRAGRVKGLQVGVVNLSDTLDGIALGLVNISKSGGVHPIVWGGGELDLNLGLKFAPNDYWYSILSYGRENEGDKGEKVQYTGFYLGFHLPVPIVPGLYAELDRGTKSIISVDDFSEMTENDFSTALETRAVLGIRLYGIVSLFAGVAYKQTGDNIKWFGWGETNMNPLFGLQLASLY